MHRYIYMYLQFPFAVFVVSLSSNMEHGGALVLSIIHVKVLDVQRNKQLPTVLCNG